ncbi:SPFH domain-containing protein [Streptococcus acidominimus]|uniref:Antifreeze protein type I n=1 Tax=Streptococcus acidominimus TaxID=1326 RepID=A0A1Q8ECW1_STRAI|nr:SPFH domain-containing protein [Streptococcus acidominimus]OLF49623.1 antifreeze protein type I [Streptococcus acidominimus]SUN08225.1 Putative virion core protein (lumpy skin disease virus) [Streptococcus acidominimus]
MPLIDLVKYNGNPNVLAWKYPNDELSTFTQLIVNEFQEAVLVKEGKIADIFPAGRYTLDTANIPILNNIVNLPFDGESPFTAEVWYINKAYCLDIKWGTPTPIQLQAPGFGIFVPVRAHGTFGIKVTNSEIFLKNLVGTLPNLDTMAITNFFKGLYVTKVKDAISSYLVKKNVGILEINAHLNDLSNFLANELQPFFQQYGVSLINFYINDISVPEDDEGVKQLKLALSKRAEMDIIGYNYQQERTFDALEGATKNSGSDASSVLGAGLGMAMGVGLGGNLANSFSILAQELNPQNLTQQQGNSCIKCHAHLQENAKFCSECGQKQELSCPQCQLKVELGMKFCSNCGQKLGE